MRVVHLPKNFAALVREGAAAIDRDNMQIMDADPESLEDICHRLMPSSAWDISYALLHDRGAVESLLFNTLDTYLNGPLDEEGGCDYKAELNIELAYAFAATVQYSEDLGNPIDYRLEN